MASLNLQEYCTNVETELTSWRNKLSTIDGKIQTLSCGEKEKMLGNIEELHMVMAELDDRIHALETSCPTEWSPYREEISSKLHGLSEKYESTSKELFDYDYGG